MPGRGQRGRERSKEDRRSGDYPASAWKERARLKGKPVDAGVIILRTTGCAHWKTGGCSMCGYNAESVDTVTPAQIARQFEKAVTGLGEVEMLKVYTSGSFLDEREMPRETSDTILTHCRERGLRLVVESRPEYVTSQRLDGLLSVHRDLEIAIGLESANDRVLQYSINKGFLRSDYERAAHTLRDEGIALRTYVLLKPPYLTEAEAMADAVATIEYSAPLSATVSLNPVAVHKNTLVERLWRTWAYRSPWLWSVAEVLRQTMGTGTDVICDPTAGGSERGAHNCGECDGGILDAIRGYSISQDGAELSLGDCDCRTLWTTILELEGVSLGGTYDLQRFFRKQGA